MNDIKKEVEKLIKKYGTNNPYEICDYLNIKIMCEDLGSIKGFYQSAPRNRIIHLNHNLNDKDMFWTLAHELGHAVRHSNLNILFLEKNTNFIKNKYEIEADTFAAELVIDDNLIDNYEGFTIDSISLIENIDIRFLRYKFK